jgi:cysteine desulfurase
VESFERTRLSADLLTLDAQKVGGVRGAGVLIVAPNVPLAPVIDGGGQERGLRSGTETPTLANAFATALVECAQERESFAARAALWRAALVQAITTAIPDTLVNEGKKNAPHIVNFSFLGRDTDFLAALLDERGFSVSTRSACETDSIQGSRAVRALTKDAARAISTLRISLGPATHENELKQFAKALISSVAFIDQNTL